MGFGSYDESEQENQEIDASDMEESEQQAEEAEHDGNVEFEFGASNDELLDQLHDIKEE
jgi:hypothetical protein